MESARHVSTVEMATDNGGIVGVVQLDQTVAVGGAARAGQTGWLPARARVWVWQTGGAAAVCRALVQLQYEQRGQMQRLVARVAARQPQPPQLRAVDECGHVSQRLCRGKCVDELLQIGGPGADVGALCAFDQLAMVDPQVLLLLRRRLSCRQEQRRGESEHGWFGRLVCIVLGGGGTHFALRQCWRARLPSALPTCPA
eukprot:SAG31_NODE_1357_length_8647_cov_8.257838_8_plen_199_part_00